MKGIEEPYKKPTNEQLQPFYESLVELIALTELYGNWASPYIHIHNSALKLLATLKIHMERANVYFLSEEHYKYYLPLLSQSEKDELRRIVYKSGSEELINKCDDMQLVYECTGNNQRKVGLI